MLLATNGWWPWLLLYGAIACHRSRRRLFPKAPQGDTTWTVTEAASLSPTLATISSRNVLSLAFTQLLVKPVGVFFGSGTCLNDGGRSRNSAATSSDVQPAVSLRPISARSSTDWGGSRS